MVTFFRDVSPLQTTKDDTDSTIHIELEKLPDTDRLLSEIKTTPT